MKKVKMFIKNLIYLSNNDLRNRTFNINQGTLVKNISINNTNMKKGIENSKEIVTKAFLDAINDSSSAL